VRFLQYWRLLFFFLLEFPGESFVRIHLLGLLWYDEILFLAQFFDFLTKEMQAHLNYT